MSWEILDTGIGSATENMQMDAKLLDRLEYCKRPVMHFYEWEGKCATYGYFIDPKKYFNMKGVGQYNLSLARRSTGGGIIFHIWDMAFSVLIPADYSRFSHNTLDNYAFINQAVLNAVQTFLKGEKSLLLIKEDVPSLNAQSQYFCMAKPTKYDLLLEGRKVAGAAQRKTRHGFLHQGSISLTLPSEEYLQAVLSNPSQVVLSMNQYTFPLLGYKSSVDEMNYAKQQLKSILSQELYHLSE